MIFSVYLTVKMEVCCAFFKTIEMVSRRMARIEGLWYVFYNSCRPRRGGVFHGLF